MKKKYLVSVVIMVAGGCGPKTTYKVAKWAPPDSANPQPSGLVYVLPKTDLAIEVDVETTARERGIYADYNSALGFNAALPPEQKSKVVAVRVTPSTVPDATTRFVITPENQGWLIEHGVTFQFNDTGSLIGADSSMRNRSTDVATAVLSTTASVVGSAFGFSGIGATAKAVDGGTKALFDFKFSAGQPDRGPDDNAKRCIEAVATTIGTAVPAPVPALTSGQKAAKAAPPCNAAARLSLLTQKRDLLISEAKPQIPVEAYNAVLAAITKEIDELRQLFFNKEKKEVRVWKFSFDPSSSHKCLSFSADGGKVGNWRACSDPSSDLQIDVVGTAGTCNAVPDGIVYRLPANAPFSVHQDGKQLAAGRATFPQFGYCAVAPREVYGKEAKLVVKLSDGTGMLMGFTSQERKDYSEVIAKGGEAVEKVLGEAKSAQERRYTLAEEAREKDESDRDPVKVKKRELELLELQRQIECYGSIGGPCKDPAKSNADD